MFPESVSKVKHGAKIKNRVKQLNKKDLLFMKLAKSRYTSQLKGHIDSKASVRVVL